ncbi:MAG TPA: Trm112 family protein [Bacteroidota bacterium]|nr:Trm112 family protein [Bacteroidota bacterium]
MLSDRLLKILRCPKCHGELKYDAPREQLTCVKCRRTYEVKNGIPIMLENNEPARSR